MCEDLPEWLFDESAQIGVDYSDADIVADYDMQHEGFRDFEREAREISTGLGLTKESTLLDMGCGTGALSIYLARTCKHVYAVDVSGAMIALLRRKTEMLGLENVSPLQSGFLSYEHQGEELDGIVANICLHHLPDFWKQIALCRFHDFLKPGGRLFLGDVVFDFDPRQYRKTIEDWLASMRNTAGPGMAEETVVHVRDEYSTWGWVMVGMLDRAGFRVDRHFEIMPHIRGYLCSK